MLPELAHRPEPISPDEPSPEPPGPNTPPDGPPIGDPPPEPGEVPQARPAGA